MKFQIEAASRLKATMLEADAFEGWINTLQLTYDRPDGKNYAVVDAPLATVQKLLYGNDWGKQRRNDKVVFSKGNHTIELEAQGDKKTKITDSK